MSDQLRKDGTSSSQDESFCETAPVLQDYGSAIQKDNQNHSDYVQAEGKDNKDEQEIEHRNRKRAAGKNSKNEQETEHDPKRPLLSTVAPTVGSSSTDDYDPKSPLHTNKTLGVTAQVAGKKCKDKQEIEHPGSKSPLLSTVATAGKSSSSANLSYHEGLTLVMKQKVKLEQVYKTKLEKMATEKPLRSLLPADPIEVLLYVKVVGVCPVVEIDGYHYPIIKGYQTVVNRDGTSEIVTEMRNPRESDSVSEVSVLIEQGGYFRTEVTAEKYLLISVKGSFFLLLPEDVRRRRAEVIRRRRAEVLPEQRAEVLPERQAEVLREQQADVLRKQQAEVFCEQQAREIFKIVEENLILEADVSLYCHVIEIDGELYSTVGGKTSNMVAEGSESRNMVTEGSETESPSVPQVGESFFIEHEGRYRLARVIARDCVQLCVKDEYFEVFKVRGENWWSYGTVIHVEDKTGLSKLEKPAAGDSAEQVVGNPLRTLIDGKHPIIKIGDVSLVYEGEFKDVTRASPAQNLERSVEILASQGEIISVLGGNPELAQDEGNPELVQNLENSSRTGEASGESLRGLFVKEGETKESTEGNVEEEDKGQLKKEK